MLLAAGETVSASADDGVVPAGQTGDDVVDGGGFRGGATPAGAPMEIINQILVIGERMHGFHVSTLDAIVVIDNFEHWGDGIGGAGCGGSWRLPARVDLVW